MTPILQEIARMPRGMPWPSVRERFGAAEAEHLLSSGMVKLALDQAFLSPAGRESLGLVGYGAHDPSTWAADERDMFYRMGFCHVFALALHERTGLPIVALRDRAWPGPDGQPTVLHVFVEDPGEIAYDIGGPGTREDIEDECAETAEQMRAMLGGDAQGGCDLWFHEVGTPTALLEVVGRLHGMHPFDREDVECALRVVEMLELEHGPFNRTLRGSTPLERKVDPAAGAG